MSVFAVTLTNKAPLFSQTSTLDGTVYAFRFIWNGRIGRWFFRIEDPDGGIILGDTKLVADTPLLAKRVIEGLPPGELWCWTASGADPGLFDLGQDTLILYVTGDSVA